MIPSPKKRTADRALKFLLAACTCSALCGCSHYYYSPSAHNVPLLRERSETVVTGMISNHALSHFAYELNAAHAITDHLHVLGGGGYLSVRPDEDDRAKAFYGEAAAGYGTSLHSSVVMAAYGGVGYAQQTHVIDTHILQSMDFYKPFIQGVLGYRSGMVEFAGSVKLNYLRYANVVQVPDNRYDEQIEMMRTRSFSMFEPALNLKLGHEFIFVQLQAGISIPDERRFSGSWTNFNFGLCGRFR